MRSPICLSASVCVTVGVSHPSIKKGKAIRVTGLGGP
jgi:hypothetical protein